MGRAQTVSLSLSFWLGSAYGIHCRLWELWPQKRHCGSMAVMTVYHAVPKQRIEQSVLLFVYTEEGQAAPHKSASLLCALRRPEAEWPDATTSQD